MQHNIFQKFHKLFFKIFQIAFSAKVDSFDKVIFELTYEQPLDRVNGQNNYKLHLNLKDRVIDDFKIKFNGPKSD